MIDCKSKSELFVGVFTILRVARFIFKLIFEFVSSLEKFRYETLGARKTLTKKPFSHETVKLCQESSSISVS